MNVGQYGNLSKSVTLLGIPLDFNSSFLRGAAFAPDVIRSAMSSDSSNWWSEQGINLKADGTFVDVGNLHVSPNDADMLKKCEARVADCLSSGHPLITLGGDHSISYPVLRAFREIYHELTVVHFDAHPDLYDELLGNRWSHASPFARVMEEKLATRLVQVGIRTMTGHQNAQAEKFGVEVISMRNLNRFADLRFSGPVYVSIDLDALDPAYAPGVSHYEPGGMSVRELVNCLHAIDAPLVGADVVELNPHRDTHSQTAMVAAKLVKELAACMLGGRGRDDWP
ncbi:agmatinase [Paraburkholderia sp. RP-4-7]|uniref:Agmatinase n=1 Tax=Paraburkholderia polaris TaxID=2728848 RepID=A0A848IQZ3_9BURK|nr:agmatinase [Paraburkholderia polaris]NMM03660.1 agmatinase [Paraburkholderia polaris]